ncbi:hypothetical protein SEUCBS140593_000696 [Sporothrix eucalyptigena]|uniref:Sedlin n=1 Tax=Sporothrix eucalyptigena TaxID=1812306 RepID=A0ABP0AS25_9PEZI
MASTIPSIACLGVIGRNDNPLHISIFPSYDATTNSLLPVRTPLQFSLILCGTLDIFALRPSGTASGAVSSGAASSLTGGSDATGLLLLHALDDRLAVYGYETNTGVKLVAVVDMRGRRGGSVAGGASGAGGAGATATGSRGALGGNVVGLREAELKPVFKAMQSAYVRLLQNPFYDPDEHSPPSGQGGKKIVSKRFTDDMQRIGEAWMPGITNF